MPGLPGEHCISISTRHGVTQGSKTSANFFTFVFDDLPDALITHDPLFHEINLLQLADDTALIKSSLNQLKTSLIKVIDYSNRKYLHMNNHKTHYLHIPETNQVIEDIIINDSIIMKSAPDNRFVYLGMLFTNSNDNTVLILENLKHKAYMKVIFFDWLNVNKSTVITIKLRVLDNCMYSSLLYGCEVWWWIDDVKKELLKEESERILEVKRGV